MNSIISSVRGLFSTHPYLYDYLDKSDSLSYQWFGDDFPNILKRINKDISLESNNEPQLGEIAP